MKLHGGCQCSAIRYAVDAEQILTLYCCHCLECQRQSGSGFAMSMKMPREAFTLERGQLARWQRSTDRGGINRGNFCGACGCRIYHDSGEGSSMISLKAGTLDETDALEPVGHIWTARAQSWVTFGESTLQFPGQPDSYQPLIEAWRSRRLTSNH